MRLSEIHIDQFGVWRDLTLPLAPLGLNVLYGPNEAGKTTLMRFLRGVLYGFRPSTPGGDDRRHGGSIKSGTIRIEHGGRQYHVSRQGDGTTRGEASISGFDRIAPADELLAELLSGTDERLFGHVFALGLNELQELATLQDDDVARHIYGASLGPDGETLLDVIGRLDTDRRRLFDAPSRSGELVELLQADDELAAELDSFKGLRETHAALCRQRDALKASIAELKSRQAGMQSQLRGHVFLQRVWSPWSQVRQYERELERVPVVSGFPESGRERLDRIEDELDSATRVHETLLAEAAALRKEAAALDVDPDLHRHAATIQGLVDQRDSVVEVSRQQPAMEARAGDLEAEFDLALEGLGPDWTAGRLAAVDTSPAASLRMMNAAREYHAALTRRARLRRQCKRLSKACHQRRARLDGRRKELGGLSVQDAVAEARRRLAELEDLGKLQLREAELEQRRIGIDEQLRRVEDRLALPKWAWAVLVVFGVTGIAFALMGIVFGVTTSGIAGTMYALLGTTCGGTAWALKTHFEGGMRAGLEQLQDERRDAETHLRETRTAIARLTQTAEPIAGQASPPAPTSADVGQASPLAPATDDAHTTQPSSEADLIHRQARRLAQLERWSREESRIQSRRRRLTELRTRLRTAQREVSEARQQWCGLLGELGLPETVRIDEAFQTWQTIVEADRQRRLWEAARDELHQSRQMLDAFHRRIEELGRRIPGWSHDRDETDPFELLTAWDEELRNFEQSRSEQRRLYREAKLRRREAAEYKARIDELKLGRSALLVQAGAASREEFDQRAEWAARRQDLQEYLDLAEAELESAAATEPELAIVEEDLIAYEAAENDECIRVLKIELDAIDADLEQEFETLGGLKHEIKELEHDRRPTRLRFVRAQLEDRLKRTAERWFAVQLAARAVDQVRTRVERTCQPATLATASAVLSQLTRGKYVNVWTPLGERHLCVDDDRGHSLRVEQLSGGTREQLFLAIRLTLVRELAERGVELPIVLDDVFVNFDQHRTEAAAETLLRLAEEGRQILLFTCHLHLAQLFESRGVPPIWLPGHQARLEERRAG